MKLHHVFLFCLLAAQRDGNRGLVEAEVLVHAGGGSVTAECRFSFSGRRKLLCRDACTDGNVLIETEAQAAQRGRYSLQYKEGTFPVSSTVLRVSITPLSTSDSGRYWCVLKRPFLPDSYQEFHIRVTGVPKTSPARLNPPGQQQTEEPGAEGYVMPLSVCTAVLLAASALLLYKWKLRRLSDGLTTRGRPRRSSGRNVQLQTSQKHPIVSRCADASADPVYSNL